MAQRKRRIESTLDQGTGGDAALQKSRFLSIALGMQPCDGHPFALALQSPLRRRMARHGSKQYHLGRLDEITYGPRSADRHPPRE